MKDERYMAEFTPENVRKHIKRERQRRREHRSNMFLMRMHKFTTYEYNVEEMIAPPLVIM